MTDPGLLRILQISEPTMMLPSGREWWRGHIRVCSPLCNFSVPSSSGEWLRFLGLPWLGPSLLILSSVDLLKSLSTLAGITMDRLF